MNKVGLSQVAFLAMNNRSDVERSSHSGCFHCGKTFPSSEVAQHTDAGKTCICPKCGQDCVLGEASGFPINEKSLLDAKKYLFG